MKRKIVIQLGMEQVMFRQLLLNCLGIEIIDNEEEYNFEKLINHDIPWKLILLFHAFCSIYSIGERDKNEAACFYGWRLGWNFHNI